MEKDREITPIDFIFEKKDFSIFSVLLNPSFIICDRYKVTGFMEFEYDSTILCQAGELQYSREGEIVGAGKWNHRVLHPKWRGSYLKELGLLDFLGKADIPPEPGKQNRVGFSIGQNNTINMNDAPEYTLWIYRLNPAGQEAARQILTQQ